MLVLTDIHEFYGSNHVLQGISLACSAGESLVLVGESGSGKTTLAKVIAGMEKPAAGSVLLAGNSLAAGLRQRRFAAAQRLALIMAQGPATTHFPHTSHLPRSANSLEFSNNRAWHSNL